MSRLAPGNDPKSRLASIIIFPSSREWFSFGKKILGCVGTQVGTIEREEAPEGMDAGSSKVSIVYLKWLHR